MGGSGYEPGLDDMLNDPVTQAVMASDGVAPDEIKSLLLEARRRYLPDGTVMASTPSSSAAAAPQATSPAVPGSPASGRRRG